MREGPRVQGLTLAGGEGRRNLQSRGQWGSGLLHGEWVGAAGSEA